MDLRITLASLALFTATAIAQEGQGAEQPNSGAVIEELQAEKARLLKEIDFARLRAASAGKSLAEKLGARGQSFASIDAGTNQPASPVAMQMQKARVMTEAERADLKDDVLMTIDGVPLYQGEYDTLMNYLGELPNSGPEEIRAQRVMFELIRIKTVQAAFPENDAEGQVSEVYAQLQQGKPLSELAASIGTVLGAKEDGSLEVTRNSFLGTAFERAAFALQKGETSRPIRTVFGFAVFQADDIQKGAESALDKVVGHAVLVKYAGDEKQVNLAQGKAARGQAVILVREESAMGLLPALYRPMPPVQDSPANNLDGLNGRLQAVRNAIEKLGAGDATAPDVQAQLKSLKQQEIDLMKAIEGVQKVTGDIEAGGLPAAPVKVPGKKDADQATIQPAKVLPLKK
ncbi:MAG: peptidylprolyl isomerase [Planctomycetes bacterium]|nr:peptidylprolyl isomerase [Planctomycetota bacterium]